MGLSEPRKRTKISHDPNNVSWARSTNGFGHKIMTSQGWAPGSYLGAQNATYTDYYSAASASHIRVTLKDDNLGLGARPKGGINSEPTGLDAFQGLLGRLNGKSQRELDNEQRRRDDAKIAIYVQRRWQGPTFISGGLLVQDGWNDIQKANSSTKSERRKIHEGKHCEHGEKDAVDVEKTNAPRRTLEPPSQPDVCSSMSSQTIKNGEIDEHVEEPARKREKKMKKRKDRSAAKNASIFETQPTQEAQELKPPAQFNESAVASSSPSAAKSLIPMGRQLIRGRHIHQKRRALMDDKSLSEIFMAKS